MEKRIVTVMPVYKERIWGGHKIKADFNGQTDIEPCGEMWVVAALKGNGDNYLPELDMSLSNAFEMYPNWFNCNTYHLPFRCTIIDPIADLSVQVHPDDEYAHRIENSAGKPEAWYIMDVGQGGKIQFGHNAKSKEELKDLIYSNQWDRLLNYVDAKAGEFLFVPAGGVHAIGKNVLSFEISRSADITYRLYDYDRLDKKTGKKRDLHVEKSIDVISVPHQGKGPYKPIEKSVNGLLVSEFIDEPGMFTLHKLLCQQQGTYQFSRFYFITVVKGSGTISEFKVQAGTTLLVPADFGPIHITGQLEAICSSYRYQ